MTYFNNQFSMLIGLCGLSNVQAAQYLGVRPDTIKSWRTGRRSPLAERERGILDPLLTLLAEMEQTAEQVVCEIEVQTQKNTYTPHHIIIYGAADDDDAKASGWPFMTVHHRLCSMIISKGARRGYHFKVGNRGEEEEPEETLDDNLFCTIYGASGTINGRPFPKQKR